MRFDGTLKTWNAERGFGFITPRQGGQDIFVHISAFPRDGRTPREGEILSFEVETIPEGKKRAVRVQRPGATFASAASEPRRHRPPRRSPRSGIIAVVGLVLVAALGWFAYAMYERQASARARLAGYACDGRIYCSQMKSCREAKFFLKNCPGVQMDGNRDGVPCEQQWCTHWFAD